MADNSSDTLVIRRASSKASLVFGLDWETLVGQNLEKQSLKKAKGYKASHYVRAGKHSAAFGYARLQAADRKAKGVKYYSAAAIFAQSHPQGVYWQRRDMPDDTVWVVASHDGMVISGTDIVCTFQTAQELHDALLERYEHIVQVPHDETNDDSLYYLNEQTLLAEAKSGIETIPQPVLIGIGAVMALLLADMGWDKYKSYQAQKERARQALAYIDPEDAWREELDAWQRTVRLGGKNSLLAAYDAVGAVPLDVGSWMLAGVDCQSNADGWACTAAYKRLTGTNETFERSAPSGWQVRWSGLEDVFGSWQVPYAGYLPLDRTLLPTMSQVRVNHISRIQSVMTSFERLALDPAVEVSVPAPQVVDANGNMQTISHPGNISPAVALPQTQSFRIQAPLRSLLVAPIDSNYQLDSLKVEYRVGGASSLTSSMLTATLTGKYYVQ